MRQSRVGLNRLCALGLRRCRYKTRQIVDRAHLIFQASRGETPVIRAFLLLVGVPLADRGLFRRLPLCVPVALEGYCELSAFAE
jgi:hypothetical protein